MITQQLPTRYIIYLIIVTIIISACNASGADATRQAVMSQAQTAIDAQLAAATLIGAQTVQQAAPSLWAISKAIANAPGAFMLFNDVQKVAVFLAPGGKTAGGATYWFAGFIDTAHTSLIDANRQLVEFGIDMRKITNADEMRAALRMRGFEELAPTALPTLYGALKLGLGFLRSLGGSISDVMVIPSYMLTPDMLYPWADPDWEPGIQ